MENDNKDLCTALSQSIGNEALDSFSDIAEAGLDQFIDNELLKEIPIISTATALYRIGHGIIELHGYKKLCAFIQSINDCCCDQKTFDKYRKIITDNPKKRNQQIEYLLVMINRYVGYDKPQMLAKVFLAYLDRKIDWNELSVLSEIIDRLLPGDFNVLLLSDNYESIQGEGADILMRLMSLGLIIEKIIDTGNIKVVGSTLHIGNQDVEDQRHIYLRTKLGNRLVDIVSIRIE